MKEVYEAAIEDLKKDLELTQYVLKRTHDALSETMAELIFFKSYMRELAVCPHCGQTNIAALNEEQLYRHFRESYQPKNDFDGRVIREEEPDPELDRIEQDVEQMIKAFHLDQEE